jgi:hypothetical protein
MTQASDAGTIARVRGYWPLSPRRGGDDQPAQNDHLAERGRQAFEQFEDAGDPGLDTRRRFNNPVHVSAFQVPRGSRAWEDARPR